MSENFGSHSDRFLIRFLWRTAVQNLVEIRRVFQLVPVNYKVAVRPEEHAQVPGNKRTLIVPLEPCTHVGSTLYRGNEGFFVFRKMTIPRSLLVGQVDPEWIRFNFRAANEKNISINESLGIIESATLSVACGEGFVVAHAQPFAEYYSIGANVKHLQSLGVASVLCFLDAKSNVTYAISSALKVRLLQTVDRILRSKNSEQQFNELVLNLLLETVTELTAETEVDYSLNKDNRDRIVRKAVIKIVMNPRLRFSVADLARHCHCSVRTLDYAFKTRLELSPLAYSNYVRLSLFRAAVLERPTVKLATIAQDMGYVHAGNLAKAFFQAFGELPSSLRDEDAGA